MSYHDVWRYSMFADWILVFYGPIFVALLTKYLEWSAVWNMSIVISVLEGTYGIEALLHSAYFSRGSERRGLLLMLVFFVWGQGLRLASLYFGCYEGGMGIVAQVGLLWLGNVLKWVVCMLISTIARSGLWRRKLMWNLEERSKLLIICPKTQIRSRWN
jgi:hypothetical protein